MLNARCSVMDFTVANLLQGYLLKSASSPSYFAANGYFIHLPSFVFMSLAYRLLKTHGSKRKDCYAYAEQRQALGP